MAAVVGDSGDRGPDRDRYEHIVDNLDSVLAVVLAAHTRLHEALRPQSSLSFSLAF